LQPLSPKQLLQHDPPRILVSGVNWLGDAVMTTPALLRLRERFPDAHITLLTPAKLADLWGGCRSLDAIINFSPTQSPWSVARRLRIVHADTTLVFPNSPRAALEVWAARIPERIGYSRPWRNWFLTRAIEPRPGETRTFKRSVNEIKRLVRTSRRASISSKSDTGDGRAHNDWARHHVHDYLHLAAALGATAEPITPQLEVESDELKRAEEMVRAGCGSESTRPLARRLLLGINPGAEYGPAKRWPIANFATVAREVSRRNPDCLWLIFGGANDRTLTHELETSSGVSSLNFAGKTSLRQLMALLKLCRVLLTNDTGPMHVAAALGTPVVVPFGSTAPELTAPGLPGDPRHQLLTSLAPCSPCFRRSCPIDLRCLTSITADRVVDALESTFAPR